jgi:hypothetical protein
MRARFCKMGLTFGGPRPDDLRPALNGGLTNPLTSLHEVKQVPEESWRTRLNAPLSVHLESGSPKRFGED